MALREPAEVACRLAGDGAAGVLEPCQGWGWGAAASAPGLEERWVEQPRAQPSLSSAICVTSSQQAGGRSEPFEADLRGPASLLTSCVSHLCSYLDHGS